MCGGQKRTRSWDVDVSLDELIEWDVLEQFMHDTHRDPSALAQQGLLHSLGCSASRGAGGLGDTGHSLPGPCAYSGAQPCDGDAFFAMAMCGGSTGSSVAQQHAAGPLRHEVPGGLNAASLAHTFYASSQHYVPVFSGQVRSQPLPMERSVSWGAELLPFVMGDDQSGAHAHTLMDTAALREDSLPPHADGRVVVVVGGGGGRGGRLHKQRFVWTADLHRRFEAAVNQLGIGQAKPQAISLLMACEGQGAPTRQNIKSHLQKYRLLMQKRKNTDCGAVADEATTTNGGAYTSEACNPHCDFNQHFARQEMNLKVQMELQTKLHRQLLVQRQVAPLPSPAHRRRGERGCVWGGRPTCSPLLTACSTLPSA